MSPSTTQILQIYNARRNVLELLSASNIDVSHYSHFSIPDVDAMYATKQLDMLLEHTDGSDYGRVYVKFHLDAKQLRKENLANIIDDLFVIDQVLTDKTKDTLIVVVEEEPNDTIVARLRYLHDHDGYFVVLHNIARLQFNIFKSQYVPPCKVLSAEEATVALQQFSCLGEALPTISRFDPQALALMLRPGQIVQFTRKSITALNYFFYRVCE